MLSLFALHLLHEERYHRGYGQSTHCSSLVLSLHHSETSYSAGPFILVGDPTSAMFDSTSRTEEPSQESSKVLYGPVNLEAYDSRIHV